MQPKPLTLYNPRSSFHASPIKLIPFGSCCKKMSKNPFDLSHNISGEKPNSNKKDYEYWCSCSVCKRLENDKFAVFLDLIKKS